MRPIIERLRAEFLEMPGLRLTVAQTQRLCGVDKAPCQTALDALIRARFLRINADGTYARLSDGESVEVPLMPEWIELTQLAMPSGDPFGVAVEAASGAVYKSQPDPDSSPPAASV